jgi:hypothetical protein
MKKTAKTTVKELEERFDKGEDVLQFFDTAKAEVDEPKTQRVNVDFPEWVVRRLDDEASRLGISRQSLIKLMVSAALTRRTPARSPASIISRPLASYLEDALEQEALEDTGAFVSHKATEGKNVIDLVKVLQEALNATGAASRRLRDLKLTIGRATR